MCIARVGKVVSRSRSRGTVQFFDGQDLEGVDLRAVEARRGSFVEVFAGMALSVITPAEARARSAAWRDVKNAASNMEA